MKLLTILFTLIAVTGMLAQTDSLNVSWNPNSEPDMLQYNLYKDVNNNGFNNIANIPHPTTEYVDFIVQPGDLISFYLTAEDSSNLISDPSNTVTVGIPMIIFNLTSITSGQFTDIPLNQVVTDPDDITDSLLVSTQNESNVQVTFTPGIMSLLPTIGQSTCSFDLIVQDPVGFWDFSTIILDIIDGVPPAPPTGLVIIVFPNPFTETTNILIVSSVETMSNIKVYNTLGEVVRNYLGVKLTKGRNIVKHKGIVSGNYFIRVETIEETATGRMTETN
jgi:hypothetical protein